jgi:hypothetical protein
MPEFNPITIGASRQKALEEILSKSWKELEAIEHFDRVLFPHTIVRYRGTGAREMIPVYLRVPRENEVRKARMQARRWAEEDGLNVALDPDLFDNLDTMCILSIAIRNNSEPYEPWEPDPRILESRYDRPSLDATWAKLEALRQVINPRVDEDLDRDSYIALVSLIAKKAEIDPLAGLGSDGQTNFIVRMAKDLMSFQTSKSSSDS